MLYQLLFNTHYFLLHTSYIFIFLYFYINLYVYLYIFLRFTYSSLYGLLTVHSTIFSYGFLFATVCSLYGYLYSCLPYGRLRTVPSTVFSTSFYTVTSTVISIRFSLSSLTILIYSTILFSYSI